MAIFQESFMQDLESLDAENMVDVMVPDVESLVYGDLDSVSKLQKSQRYIDTMQKVDDALQVKKSAHVSDYRMVFQDDNAEYQFIVVECTALLVDLDNEIAVVHNYIRDNYRVKYPELEGIVDHPIDYARVVKKIGNKMDLTLVDLKGILPSATIMVVSVTAATTSGGKPLSDENLKKTIDACDRALELDSAKKKVLGLLESRMRYIARNLSAIVRSDVAAKLLGTAGGLTALAKMPACNIQLLGAEKKKNLPDFSSATTTSSQLSRVGYIEETEIIQSTPPALRLRACRMLAAKSAIAVRVDYTRGDPTGETGKRLRDEIRDKIETWQGLPIAKQPKPLPVPNDEESNNKKRGGSQLRQMREKYAMTETRKLANRMQIGVPEEHKFLVI